MDASRTIDPRIRLYIYRIEAVISRLRFYSERLRGLEERALRRAGESGDYLRHLYLREAENARLSREVLEHMASRLEGLLKMLRNKNLIGPMASLMLDEVLGELSRTKMWGLVSGSPATLIAEAESMLYELKRLGGA